MSTPHYYLPCEAEVNLVLKAFTVTAQIYLFVYFLQVNEMFGSTRNQVRKRVEEAEWIQSELQALKLDKVWAQCLDYCHPKCLYLKLLHSFFLLLLCDSDVRTSLIKMHHGNRSRITVYCHLLASQQGLIKYN
jgi:hypothetical protein